MKTLSIIGFINFKEKYITSVQLSLISFRSIWHWLKKHESTWQRKIVVYLSVNLLHAILTYKKKWKKGEYLDGCRPDVIQSGL